MAERLTMQEIIDHCEETIQQIEYMYKTLYDDDSYEHIVSNRYWEHRQVAEWLRELQKYKDLEEQGRLIELPCKIGDTVYYINTHNRLSLFKNTVYEAKVARFVTTRYGTSIVIQIRNEYGCTELYSEDNYNKTVFLTKEEAEAALKGAEE